MYVQAIIGTISYFRYLDVDFAIAGHWKPHVVRVAVPSSLKVISHEDKLVITDSICVDRNLDILYISTRTIAKEHSSINQHLRSTRWNGGGGQVE
jgi:hypothetical protein